MTKNEAMLETVNTMISELKAFGLVNDQYIGQGIKGQHCAGAIKDLERMADQLTREISTGRENW